MVLSYVSLEVPYGSQFLCVCVGHVLIFGLFLAGRTFMWDFTAIRTWMLARVSKNLSPCLIVSGLLFLIVCLCRRIHPLSKPWLGGNHCRYVQTSCRNNNGDEHAAFSDILLSLY